MYYSLDRFENQWAVLIDDKENSHTVKRTDLPAYTQVGDVLFLNPWGAFTLDEKETQKRRERILQLQSELFQ